MTLAEVIVALVLVAVGLLGVAGSASLAARAISVHSMALRASARARLRLVLLDAAGCANATSGAVDDPLLPLREHWRVTSRTPGTVMIDDSLAWSANGQARHLVVRSALLC